MVFSKLNTNSGHVLANRVTWTFSRFFWLSPRIAENWLCFPPPRPSPPAVAWQLAKVRRPSLYAFSSLPEMAHHGGVTWGRDREKASLNAFPSSAGPPAVSLAHPTVRQKGWLFPFTSPQLLVEESKKKGLKEFLAFLSDSGAGPAVWLSGRNSWLSFNSSLSLPHTWKREVKGRG